MLKSIIAAAFMTTVFTIVTVSAVSVTGEQALALPVSPERASNLLEQCMLSAGEALVPDEGDEIPGNTLTLGCCAINSEGTKWCVACNGGTKLRPTDCSVVTKARVPGSKIPKPGLSTRPSGSQLAPTKKKPLIPPVMGTIQKAPVANAPTKDKPKKPLPSTTGTIMKTVPMKQYKMAPAKQK